MAVDAKQYVSRLGAQAKLAARQLATLSTTKKNAALERLARLILAQQDPLVAENKKDLEGAAAGGVSAAFLDRLKLTRPRMEAMAEGVRQVAALPDPVGEVISGTTRPNGLRIRQVRVPLGVIGFIYESRPNVTVDAAALCLKSGNAVILRGGKEALHSNVALCKLVSEALAAEGIDRSAVQMIDVTEHEVVNEMARCDRCIDVIIPRGGEALIRSIVANATVPVIKHYKGVCHVFVDEAADLDMALRICVNAKVQRPSVCNAMETMLIHEAVAEQFLPRVVHAMREHKVELRGCERTRRIVPDVKVATEDDWCAEYLDLILTVRVVPSLDEAIEHIAKYGSAHSDAIVTNNVAHADEFVQRVDSAAVFVNASTRFCDGFEFGMGAEIGISTDKLHARGPMGLRELTSYKWVVYGEGQLRQ
jgi:glutamate-5-semialdehyde dehydrogenase